MDLVLMPIVVSIAGLILFSIPILIGGGMRLFQRTASLGKRILIYSSLSFLVGLAGCWIGFGFLLLAWGLWGELPLIQSRTFNISLPLAIFWVSGPISIVLGAILARRILRRDKPRDPAINPWEYP